MASDRRVAALGTRGWGEGRPAVLCWPGLPITAHAHFDEAGPRLAETLGARVLAVEPPGWVGDALGPEEYRPSTLARRAVRLLDELELERVAYVGWSWGGIVGCHVAALAPERLSALVLLDAGFTDLQDDPGYEERPYEQTLALLEGQGFRFPEWEPYLEVMRGRSRTWRPELEARARAAMREQDGELVPRVPMAAMAAVWHGIADEPPSGTLEALGRSGVPVLLVAASETTSTEHGRAALDRFRERVPQADVRPIDSSHDVLADALEETLAIVGTWLPERLSRR